MLNLSWKLSINKFFLIVSCCSLINLTISPVYGDAAFDNEDNYWCNPYEIGDDPNRIVCACDNKHCSQINFQWPEESGDVSIVRSSEEGFRFKVETTKAEWDYNNAIIKNHVETSSCNTTDTYRLGADCRRNEGRNRIRSDEPTLIMVNSKDKHQTIMGFGGAFTDATGYNVVSLSERRANQLMESYFGPTGLDYNLGRVPIGGSDFSIRAYSYDDSTKPDYNLTKWALADEDIALKIPMIKKAMRLMGQNGTSDGNEEKLKLIGAPWSPPIWMKANNNFIRGHLINTHQIYKTYAEYLMKFFDAYEEKGVKFFGTSVQNEPFSASLIVYFFNSLQFSAEEQISFIQYYLGPAMEARNRTKENGFHLMIGEDNLSFYEKPVIQMLKVPEVKKYVSGLGYHWYTSGMLAPYSTISTVHEAIKNDIQFTIMSEACTGSMPWERKVDLGSWKRAEMYASDIINDLNRETNAWIDWNMALNMQGGPNWARNFVDSPIIVDASNDRFYKQPMYYALAHFSRLFRPGSTVIGTRIVGGDRSFREKLLAIAVHKKDSGHIIINILNKSTYTRPIELRVRNHDIHIPNFVIGEKSLVSIVVKL